MLQGDSNMQIPEKFNERRTATAGGSFGVLTDEPSECAKIFKTKPFSAAC
jgi:hypothetical protein